MKKITFLPALAFSLFILIYSCSKEDTTFSGSSNSNVRTTITGMVLDESNAAVANVNVTAYSQTTTTNQYGVFVLKDVNVDKERCIVQFSKAGYFNRAHAFIATANTVNYVRVVMISNAQTHTLNATSGGTISLPDNSSVQFAPNSFVTTTGTGYTGTVSLTVKHLSPDDANFGFMIPGGDLAGENMNGDAVVLITYGMIGVEIKGSSGETLQLAAGTTATITLSIAASQQSSAPATIPLWYFDEATSLWKEEGTATKVGNNYVGTVQHFSWWNYDYQGPRATVKGKVVDCADFPVPNVVVTIDGWWNTTTNQNGEYINWVPSGFSFTIQVLAINNPGWLTQDSQIEIIPVLSAGQIFIVPDLVIPCPTRVAGTIKTCSGENTSGSVFISNTSGFVIYQYSQNGFFNLPVIPNSQLEFTAYNLSNNHNQTITSLSAPNVLNVGNILLCDSTIVGNSFVLDGYPFSNQLFNIIPSSAFGSIVYVDSLIEITLSGYSSAYSISFQTFKIYGVTLGSYLGYVDIISIIDSLNTYSVFPNTPITVNLTQVDSIGGRIKGNYFGNCVISGDSSSNSGTMAGFFDVLRIQ